MPFYDNNDELKKQYYSLPREIKDHIDKGDGKIGSVAELNELIRRIEAAEHGKL